MAFPFLREENFESGGVTAWTSETDTNSKLNVRHYTALAARNLTPYRGAYGCHLDLSLGTADAYLQEDTAADLALDASWGIRFRIYVTGLVTATSDIFHVLVLQSAGPVDEISFGIRNSAGTLQLWAGETGATRTTDLIQGVWHTIELWGDLDIGGGNDGTISFAVDGEQVGAQITALDQAAVAQLRIGAMNIDAGTTAGHIVIDDFVMDDARVGYDPPRFAPSRVFTQSGHLFIGPGSVDSAAILSTTAGNTCYLWDTDTGNVTIATRLVELAIGANTTAGGPIRFLRGCYVAIAGTNPRAQVAITLDGSVSGESFLGPPFYSQSGYKSYAERRKPRAANS